MSFRCIFHMSSLNVSILSYVFSFPLRIARVVLFLIFFNCSCCWLCVCVCNCGDRLSVCLDFPPTTTTTITTTTTKTTTTTTTTTAMAATTAMKTKTTTALMLLGVVIAECFGFVFCFLFSLIIHSTLLSFFFFSLLLWFYSF